MQVYRERESRFPLPLKILLITVAVVGISFSLAWVWQTTETTAAVETTSSEAEEEAVSSALPAEPIAKVTSTPEVEQFSSPPAASPPPEEESASEPAPPVENLAFVVPAREAVDSSYFDDAIFLGDSITTGIPLYHIADNAAVVAFTGINTDNINTKKCIESEEGGDEERLTILEKAATHAPRRKVYIMLGGNGMGFDIETFLSGYKRFLDQVKVIFPDATIYLQSITPVVEGYVNEIVPELDNDLINTYNLEIMEFARREGVYYLDVGSALKNEKGFLPIEASPTDGMHFIPEYYLKWFEYLKTHTVEETK